MKIPLNGCPHWRETKPWKPEDVIADCIKRLREGLSRIEKETEDNFKMRFESWKLSVVGMIWLAKQELQ